MELIPKDIQVKLPSFEAVDEAVDLVAIVKLFRPFSRYAFFVIGVRRPRQGARRRSHNIGREAPEGLPLSRPTACRRKMTQAVLRAGFQRRGGSEGSTVYSCTFSAITRLHG
jgi:hypothetical protein